jgi:hypothetical protein
MTIRTEIRARRWRERAIDRKNDKSARHAAGKGRNGDGQNPRGANEQTQIRISSKRHDPLPSSPGTPQELTPTREIAPTFL